ncbi:cytochrome P450 oxidoreductase, putative [Rhizoctonia solani AG-1 IA]|uniref:Cytochrome P450 oxidoreductase, putative n=1 Tax=Thanatephorus cucumeris (strain AG1-IA) TaxID=983506 RepID=L8XA33_THACA|nr:cytochrome P450 oxidoreductase, putative [Rhizoctonia solani AG-1 IA]
MQILHSCPDPGALTAFRVQPSFSLVNVEAPNEYVGCDLILAGLLAVLVRSGTRTICGHGLVRGCWLHRGYMIPSNPNPTMDLWAIDPLVRWLIGTVLALLIIRYWNWPGSRYKDMPPGNKLAPIFVLARANLSGNVPGPRSLPIVGNAHQLKHVDVYAQLRDLNEKYGPLASLKIGSSNMIVVGGDGSLVRQLLDKRGAIYSNRPLEFQQDTDKWRNARKLIVQHYAPRAVKTEHIRLQEAESTQLVHDFLHKPKDFMRHPMRYTTSVITYYGVRCATHQDRAVCSVEQIMEQFTTLNQPGAKPPVENFPLLWHVQYLPDSMMMNWKSRTKKIGELMDKVYGDLAEIAWERGINGLNTNTLAYKIRINEDNNGLTRHQQAYVCGIVLEGGSDITPDDKNEPEMKLIVRGLYDEDTLPKYEDEQEMPFVRAVIKEVLRWRPPLPAAVPHRLEQDDYYEGYYIPKDSSIICNIWAIHSNPDRYEDPHLFKPERFLDHTMSMADSIAQGDPFKRDHFAFGAGKSLRGSYGARADPSMLYRSTHLPGCSTR